MVQVGPNLTPEVWNFCLKVMKIDPSGSNALRKILISQIRESLVEFINMKAKEENLNERLVISNAYNNKIILKKD